MKLACSVDFVCSNYSTSFRSDDSSSFKEFGQVGKTAKKCHTNVKIKMSQLIAQIYKHSQTLTLPCMVDMRRLVRE